MRHLCYPCLGSFSGIRDPAITDEERGRTVLEHFRDKLTAWIEPSDQDSCEICQGIFLSLDKLAGVVKKDLGEYEFSTILVGSREPSQASELEKEISMIIGSDFDPLKKRFNRKFGKLLEEQMGKAVDFLDPDIIVTVDLRYFSFSYTVKSLYVGGTYTKDSRNIPQTRWIHAPVNDADASVESVIGNPLCEMAKGENFYLHGSGREDVDVRMLGNGREFILEVSGPRIRSLDLSEATRKINNNRFGVQVANLRFSSKPDVARIKKAEYDKSYRAVVRASGAVNSERLLSAAQNLSGKDIYQRTPLRVSTRRSDIVRVRNIRNIRIEQVSGETFTMVTRAQSGTYIKELITGDSGRTVPSLSQEYGEPLEVLALDVIWIHRDGD
ncbi:tRNA pseudouridine(54/55) synthase Pus10 [Thermoplasmatales archaeon AK]|nr:tRNA pseudouridine(54/55) synthase Pus10 [Thermoplasmatales archaeon AK]